MARPKSPTALTQGQRRTKSRAALLERGGRVLPQIELQPEAARALALLIERHGGQTAAINAALIAAGQNGGKTQGG